MIRLVFPGSIVKGGKEGRRGGVSFSSLKNSFFSIFLAKNFKDHFKIQKSIFLINIKINFCKKNEKKVTN